MRHSATLAIVIVLLACLAGPAASAAESKSAADTASRGLVRLVLANGGHYDVRGPVTRRDGLVLFYDQDGTLSSIRESEVREVRPVADDGPTTASVPKAAKPAVAVRPEARTTAAEFSNADLPDAGPAGEAYTNVSLPEPYPALEGAITNDDLPEAPESASGESPEAEAGESAETGSDATQTPVSEATSTESAAGATDTDWKGRLAKLDAEIDRTEVRLATARRLLSCIERDLPLDSDECRPTVNQQGKSKTLFQSPTEKSLREEANRMQKRLDQLAADRESLVDDARAAGAEID